MTKEEIAIQAKAYAESNWLCHPMEREDYERAFLKGAEAMELYAKQQAITFDKWKFDNKWQQSMVHGSYLKENELPFKNASELYDQFLEHQQSQQIK